MISTVKVPPFSHLDLEFHLALGKVGYQTI